MLTKTEKRRLIKVCKVLFPKYKRITVDRKSNNVLFQEKKNWFIRWFFPKLKLSVTEVIEFRIPKQMADFKYGNTTFINHIQEDLVRCEMNKINKIDYFLEEITKIKCSNIYRQLKTIPNSAPITHNSVEDDVFESMILLYKEKEITKPMPVKSYWVSKESLFYILLFILMLYSCIRSLIP
jgi:hypothetical protein